MRINIYCKILEIHHHLSQIMDLTFELHSNQITCLKSRIFMSGIWFHKFSCYLVIKIWWHYFLGKILVLLWIYVAFLWDWIIFVFFTTHHGCVTCTERELDLSGSLSYLSQFSNLRKWYVKLYTKFTTVIF